MPRAGSPAKSPNDSSPGSKLNHTMHARQQSEIAAWLAVLSASLLKSTRNHDALLAQHYWTNSKIRTGRWNAALKVFAEDFNDPAPVHNPWPAFEIIAEEIFLSEMLTRIWATYLVSVDIQNQREEYTGLVYSTFIAHVETKNRVFRLMLSAQGKNEAVFERLNQLRRLVEKWTDLFLAWFPQQEVAQQFTFDRKRLNEFVQERGYYDDQQAARQQEILISSMLRGFNQSPSKWSANPELNRRIVDGVLACLDNEAFAGTPVPGSMRQLWVEKAHTDTQVLVEQLNQLDGAQPTLPRPHFMKLVK